MTMETPSQSDRSTKMSLLPNKEKYHPVKLLSWMLFFLLLFSSGTFFVVLIINPHHDPACNQYLLQIGSLVFILAFAYLANKKGRYYLSAGLLVAVAGIIPWSSILFDPSILQGDIFPLTYLTFSILLSGIFLPVFVTVALAVIQLAGVILVLVLTSIGPSINWFSFMNFIFMTAIFSILVNYIIQKDIKKITRQAQQLASNEARLQELSVRDHLTGLYNRRYLEETLEREIQRMIRIQHPLGIIMMDVDQFKKINDTLGHTTGDLVLKGLGEFLVGQVRQSDVVCRYGGDEFVIIMPDTPPDVVKDRSENIRSKLKDYFLEHEIPPLTSVSVSQGVAFFPDHGSNGEEVLKAADTALLKAKQSRSGCIVVKD